ncbi:hypothetical protein D3C87_1929210 [compost metagenome]
MAITTFLLRYLRTTFSHTNRNCSRFLISQPSLIFWSRSQSVSHHCESAMMTTTLSFNSTTSGPEQPFNGRK